MVQSIASSLGFGSGIDTVALVADLASASRDPKVKRLDAMATANQAKISALATARSDLDSFASSLAEVVSSGDLRSQPSISDTNALGAVANAGVRLGNLAAEIEITQLARAQTSYSGFVVPADPVGQGNLTLSVGGQTFPVAITAANDTLQGLADAINSTGSTVRANIITDGANARLVLKGTTGAAQAFTLTTDAGADPALERFTYGGAGSLMTLGQSALDATFKVDGVAYNRPSNTINDVLAGVTLSLKKAAIGVPISVGSTRPTDVLKQTVADFVSVFNTLKGDVARARRENGGDSAMRLFDQQLNSLVTKSVTSDTEINSLSDIGISFNKDGTVSVNDAKLSALLVSNPDAVEALFNPLRDVTHTAETDPGISLTLQSIKTQATSSSGALEALRSRLEKQGAVITANREKMETREDAYRARLEKQFGSMDAKIGALKATQSYLEQQIKLWSNEQN
ncbi:MAG: flagellar filament capping protein FliD [Sphingorhabdus sp.]